MAYRKRIVLGIILTTTGLLIPFVWWGFPRSNERIAHIAATYDAHTIPEEIRAIAATIDWYEEQRAETSENHEAIDAKELAYLQSVDPVLKRYAKKALRAHNTKLLKLIHILQSRAFVFYRSAT
jgi:hypothetical protein